MPNVIATLGIQARGCFHKLGHIDLLLARIHQPTLPHLEILIIQHVNIANAVCANIYIFAHNRK